MDDKKLFLIYFSYAEVKPGQKVCFSREVSGTIEGGQLIAREVVPSTFLIPFHMARDFHIGFSLENKIAIVEATNRTNENKKFDIVLQAHARF